MDLEESIQTMTGKITAILGANARSVWLYGSVALNDFCLGWSDIDILVLTFNEISEQDARTLLGLRDEMLASNPGNVHFRLFEGGMVSLDALLQGKNERAVYWGTSGQRIADNYFLDSFAVAELLEHGRLLYGEDTRAKFAYPTEVQFFNDVSRHLQTIRKHARSTGRSILSFGWLLDVARGIFTLQTGKVIAKTTAGEWALQAGICPVEVAPELRQAIEVRRDPIAAKGKQSVLDSAESLGPAIQAFGDVLERELESRYPSS